MFNEEDRYDYRQMERSTIDVSQYFTKVFAWMFIGLAVTFGTAFSISLSDMYNTVSNLFLVFFIVELIIVIVLSSRITSLNPIVSKALFLAYSFVTGLTFGFLFIEYELSSLIVSFMSAAVYFGLLAAYGATTKKDLSGWGPKLILGLVALIICSIFNIFIGFGGVISVIYCGVGLIIFMLLTAYDTQKLYRLYDQSQDSESMIENTAIYGALSLYLDFINIFLYILRLLGKKK